MSPYFAVDCEALGDCCLWTETDCYRSRHNTGSVIKSVTCDVKLNLPNVHWNLKQFCERMGFYTHTSTKRMKLVVLFLYIDDVRVKGPFIDDISCCSGIISSLFILSPRIAVCHNHHVRFPLNVVIWSSRWETFNCIVIKCFSGISTATLVCIERCLSHRQLRALDWNTSAHPQRTCMWTDAYVRPT